MEHILQMKDMQIVIPAQLDTTVILWKVSVMVIVMLIYHHQFSSVTVKWMTEDMQIVIRAHMAAV